MVSTACLALLAAAAGLALAAGSSVEAETAQRLRGTAGQVAAAGAPSTPAAVQQESLSGGPGAPAVANLTTVAATGLGDASSLEEGLAGAAAVEGHYGTVVKWAGAQEWGEDYCMSVAGNVFKNGQKMQIWRCANGMGQYFTTSSGGGAAMIQPQAAPGFCVVINGNENYNGAKVQLWECDPTVQAQFWTFQAIHDGVFALSNAAYPDMCLVVNGNRGYNGNKLQLWKCDFSVRQAWDWNSH